MVTKAKQDVAVGLDPLTIAALNRDIRTKWELQVQVGEKWVVVDACSSSNMLTHKRILEKLFKAKIRAVRL